MENTQIKLSETVMVIDVAYLNLGQRISPVGKLSFKRIA